MPCLYSRAGYRDPYEAYRWDSTRSFSTASNDANQHQDSASAGHALFDVTGSDTGLDENGHNVTAISHPVRATADAPLQAETIQPVSDLFDLDNADVSNGMNLENHNTTQVEYHYPYSMEDPAFQWDERVDSLFFNAFGQLEPQMPALDYHIVAECTQGRFCAACSPSLTQKFSCSQRH